MNAAARTESNDEPHSKSVDRVGLGGAPARRLTWRHPARWWALAVSGVKGAPVSSTLLAAVSAVGLANLAVGSGTLHRNFTVSIGAFEDLRLWTAVSSGLLVRQPVEYIVFVVALALAAAPLERRVGSARFVIAAATTQVLGVFLSLGVARLTELFDKDWGLRLHNGAALGTSTWIVGVAMVASSQMSTLWRRRLRFGTLALLTTLMLFSGHLQDVITLTSAVVGIALGPVIVGKSARGTRLAGTRREGRVLIALIVAVSALGPMIAALRPDAIGPFAVLRDVIRGVPYTVTEVRDICAASVADPECRTGMRDLQLGGIGPKILSLMPSIFLLSLADGLRRGRRFAWRATIVVQMVLLIASVANYAIPLIEASNDESIFYGMESPALYPAIVPFLLPTAVTLLLLLTRGYFDVGAPRGTYRKCGRSVVKVGVILAALYVSLGVLTRYEFDPRPSALTLAADFPQRLIPPVYLQWLEPRLLPNGSLATIVFEWTGVIFWAAMCLFVLGSFLKSGSDIDNCDTERARTLLTSGTSSALSWMTTWKGNTYWFSPDRTSYVAYRVISGVALTTGNPVGPRNRLRDNVIDFAEFAVGNGWTPCFYSVTSEVRVITDSLGWGAIQVGEETILDLEDLTFTGKRFQDVRTSLNRAKKDGIQAEWLNFADAPRVITDQIAAISEEWVADKGIPEMGFTLGGNNEIDDPQVRCLVAVDGDRTVHGITSWLPVYENGKIVGWTLDFMRRRSAGFRPAMEFLIASAAISLREEGARFLSLSGAPLAKLDDARRSAPNAEYSASSPALDSLLEMLGKTLEPVYGFRSLLAFKSKFQPRYEQMHMVFADTAALPSIGNAVARAYLPEISLGQSYRLVRTLITR